MDDVNFAMQSHHRTIESYFKSLDELPDGLLATHLLWGNGPRIRPLSLLWTISHQRAIRQLT